VTSEDEDLFFGLKVGGEVFSVGMRANESQGGTNNFVGI
jgi:hypothetical protein